MRKTIIESVAKHARKEPDKLAVITRSSQTGYGELYELVCGFCDVLQDNGVQKGDFVVYRASQNLEFAVIYLAVHLAGGVAVPLERSIPDEGMAEVASKLQAQFLLGDRLDAPAGCRVIPRGDVVEAARSRFRGMGEREFPQLSDSADILYTTGTTGVSKGVEITHNTVSATAENGIYGYGYREDTVIVVPGPLNHASGIRKMYASFANGSAIYMLNGMMNMKAFFDALECGKGRIGCCLVPSAVRTIFSMSGDKLGDYADTIDFVSSEGASLPEADKAHLRALLPKSRLYDGYGLSEIGSLCFCDYNRYPDLIGCVGRALPNSEVIFVDENKNEIRTDASHPGFIACRGDVNMKGYVNEPELTREVLRDGVVYTNDLGYRDENGFIFFAGRQGDVISVGGLKVAPTEVESAALAFDGVEDCICLGVDDPVSGKALKLLVVLREGEELNQRALGAFLKKKLEEYKVPRYYEAVDEVKKTYNGKPDRKAYL